MTKAVGYCRVSTLDQANKGVSLAAQEDRIRAYAHFANLEIVDICVDKGASGKNLKRPALETALRILNDKNADILIVYSIDRLSRSTLDLLQTIDELNGAGCGFVSVREQLDSSTPHGRFTLTILGGLAQMERELISARTKEALNKIARKGCVIGQVPYGFKAVKKKLVQIPEEQKIIIYIRKMVNNGEAYNYIAKQLNRLKVKPKKGRRWYSYTVRSVYLSDKKRRERR